MSTLHIFLVPRLKMMSLLCASPRIKIIIYRLINPVILFKMSLLKRTTFTIFKNKKTRQKVALFCFTRGGGLQVLL